MVTDLWRRNGKKSGYLKKQHFCCSPVMSKKVSGIALNFHFFFNLFIYNDIPSVLQEECLICKALIFQGVVLEGGGLSRIVVVQ